MQWEIVPEESSNENCSEKLMKIPRVISVTEPLFVVAAELKLNFPKPYEWVPGGKKCLFFGKYDVLCFLKTPGLIFALLLY